MKVNLKLAKRNRSRRTSSKSTPIGSGLAEITVYVTAPNLKAANALAKKVTAARLAACANVGGPITSHYWWSGKMETSEEFFILFKTNKASYKPLEEMILKLHPYDCPAIVAWPCVAISNEFSKWIRTQLKSCNY